MKKYYTIQVVPEDSTRSHSYHIAKVWVKLFSWLLCLAAVLLCVFIWKFTEINVQLASSWKLKADNEWLLKRHSEYEAVFANLDSIYSIEGQIQNILSTFFEDDSGGFRSILDKNLHISSKKVQTDVDFETELNMNKVNLEAFPNMLPVIGGVISRSYTEEHKAVDFVSSSNDPVHATASGRVTFAGSKDDLGNMLEIEHDSGVKTRYAHLSRFSVRSGSYVKKGEVIAFMGNTGYSTGSHLHYEILLNDVPVNPERYF